MNWITEDGVDVCFAKKHDIIVKNGKEAIGPEYLYVMISIKGSHDRFEKALKNESAIRHYSEKYPKAYQAWMDGEETAQEGTPLTELAGISAELANRYKALGIRSIEELAEASDAVLQNLGHEARPFQRAAKDKIELEQLKAMKELMNGRQERSGNSPAEHGHDRSGAPEQPRRRGRPRSKKDAGDSKSSGA